MDLSAANEKLLKALAIAMVDHPAGTFKDIAEAAGVSKATLNRFCGTRNNLIEMLFNYGSSVITQVMDNANLQEAPPLEALQLLIENQLAHRELLAFLTFQWKPDSLDEHAGGSRWKPYSDALDNFFLRGQREGVFLIDISAQLMTEMFASIIYGFVDAERRGRVARVGMATQVMQFFLQGATSR